MSTPVLSTCTVWVEGGVCCSGGQEQWAGGAAGWESQVGTNTVYTYLYHLLTQLLYSLLLQGCSCIYCYMSELFRGSRIQCQPGLLTHHLYLVIFNSVVLLDLLPANIQPFRPPHSLTQGGGWAEDTNSTAGLYQTGRWITGTPPCCVYQAVYCQTGRHWVNSTQRD